MVMYMDVFVRIVGVLFFCCIIFVFLGMYRTWQTQHGTKQKLFLAGSVPHALPDGFYKGMVRDYKGPWIGKKFDAEKKKGTNTFLQNNKHIEQYPFAVYTGTGLQDKKLPVIKIDYNIPENPFWVRLILDEIVVVEPGVYLGKIHIQLIPFLPFSVGFFQLEKEK